MIVFHCRLLKLVVSEVVDASYKVFALNRVLYNTHVVVRLSINRAIFSGCRSAEF